MLLATQELLGALASGLDRLSPGAGAKAAFESPKAAAHGDLACTAAMQLAKPLKQNPRQVAEALKAAEIPLSSQKWDVGQCQQVLAIVADIVPADTETEEV